MSLLRSLAPIKAGQVTVSKMFMALIILVSAVVGGVVTSLLPRGDVPLIVAEGHAQLTMRGSGSFQPDDGVTALLPANVWWTDSGGGEHVGGRPSCLWDEKNKGNENKWSRVEAGYRWMKMPSGGSYPLVAWLRCP
ncbi:hypothetical protein [Sphaerisporangium corydalis]|uniref:Uncharacterized protein n=1 Tax=Sphaerisporangium corydalis TaxID=1441875 RepID=A0ABV9EGF2_9ACTN|nr:hypothetical protein [Sphaerisporangium corydalis]